MQVGALVAHHGTTVVSPSSGAPTSRPARLPVPRSAPARTLWPTVSAQQRVGDHKAALACAERSPFVSRLARMSAPPCPVPIFKVAPTRCSPVWVAQRRAIGRAALSKASGSSLPPASGPPASVRQHWRYPESSLAPGAVFEPDSDGLTGAVTRAASTMFGGPPIPRLEAARVCSALSGARDFSLSHGFKQRGAQITELSMAASHHPDRSLSPLIGGCSTPSVFGAQPTTALQAKSAHPGLTTGTPA
jgi:hypothetical protein